MYKIRTDEEKVKHSTRIKKIFKEKKIKAIHVSKNTGIAQSGLCEIVSGLQTDMLLSTAKKIANYTGNTIDELFGEGIPSQKLFIIKEIDKVISKLHPNDATSFVYWGKFRDFVEAIEVNPSKVINSQQKL